MFYTKICFIQKYVLYKNMFYTKICFIQKYVLYRNMLFFGDFFNTQSDQNILQNAPNCTTFSKFSQGS